MPTVTVSAGRQGARQPAPVRHPKATIVTENGVRLVLPFAPREVEHDGFTDEFANLSRAGRKPLTVRTGDGLRAVSFGVFLGYGDPQRSVEPLLKTLARIAAAGDSCVISLSALEAGRRWNLTGLTVSTLMRQHGTNAVTRANVSLTFTEDVEAVIKVGPISGGKKPKKPKKGKGNKDDKGPRDTMSGGTQAVGVGGYRPNAPGSRSKPTTQRHTVARGETLPKIALLYYGDPSEWRRIAQASDVRDPRKLKAGDRLIIPPDK